jgi:hypothetical protein
MTDDSDDVETNGPEGDADDADTTDDGIDADDGVSLMEARQLSVEAAHELLDHEFEGVVRVEDDGDGWRTLVEVVERSAVPDTQDIIGRYEVTLDADGDLTGYGLVERYRRGEMREEL